MKKLRFLVKTYGEERQIFSVREAGDGSIVVIFKIDKSGFTGMAVDVKNYHITVHSPQIHGDRKCEGYRVKSSLLTRNNDYYYESIVVRKRSDNKFIWPAISVLSSAVFGEGFSFREKKSDELVKIVGHPGIGETLNYTIFVCNSDVYLPRIQGFGRIEREIGLFKIVIYTTFLHVSSGSITLNAQAARGALRKGRAGSQPLGSAQDPKALNPFTLNAIEKYLQRTHSELAANYLRLADRNLIPIVPKEFRVPWERPVFSRWPEFNDTDHENYGEDSHRKNDRYSAPNFVDGTPKPSRWTDPVGIIRTASSANLRR